MSNNNRRESQNNYPQHRHFPPRHRHEQGPPHPHHPQPYQGNAHYPPHFYPPPPLYPPYNEDQMRHAYNQPTMPNPYYYPQYAPYPMSYPNYQHQYPYPHQQQAQNQTKKTSQRRNYQDKPVQQKIQKSSEQRQKMNYPPRRQYENRSDRNDRYQTKNQHRSERNYQLKQPKNESPRIDRLSRQEQSDKKQQQSDNYSQYSNQSSNDSESEEVIYRRKAIAKKKDPVLDSKQEIRKWIEARRKNYPKNTIKPQEAQSKVQQSEMSILQKKIRKKILLINSDPKNMMKKQKDIDILRRFILYSRKPRKNVPVPTKKLDKQQPEEAIQSIPSLPVVEEERVEVEQAPVINKQQTIIAEVAEEEGEEAVEQPIKNESKPRIEQPKQRQYGRRQELSVDVIIKHLQMKQAEDSKTLESLMDYKSNSFHYRYQHQTLETNLLLENIFAETSYILQAIRYIVKNNFFDQLK